MKKNSPWKEDKRKEIKDVKTYPIYLYFPESEIKYDAELRFLNLDDAKDYMDEVRNVFPKGTVIEYRKGNPLNQNGLTYLEREII